VVGFNRLFLSTLLGGGCNVSKVVGGEVNPRVNSDCYTVVVFSLAISNKYPPMIMLRSEILNDVATSSSRNRPQLTKTLLVLGEWNQNKYKSKNNKKN